MSETNLGDALKAYLEKSRIKNGMQALQIQDAWEKIMGKTVAKYTENLQVVNKTLFVQSAGYPQKQKFLFPNIF